jgi:hypothetical protein
VQVGEGRSQPISRGFGSFTFTTSSGAEKASAASTSVAPAVA